MTTGITSRRSSNYQNISSYETNEKQNSVIKNQISQLKKDAEKSCKLLKVKKTIFFDFPDNELDTIPLLKIIKTIENTIKKIKPDRIYTSHYGDLNIDHKIVFDATLTACRPVHSAVKEILCFEILSSTDWAFSYEFKPNYDGYDFIIPSKDIKKSLRKMKFFLRN